MATNNDLARVQSHQYPDSHVGHLSLQQQSALEKFKQLCSENGYLSPTASGKPGAPSHDDETLLRFLRARKFEPVEAFKQFSDTETWRKTNRIEELYETIEVAGYEETRRLYPQWTGRRDRRGIPVYLFEVAPLNSKTVTAYDKSIAASAKAAAAGDTDNSRNAPTKMLRLFALYENLTRFVMPLCTALGDRHYPETPVSQSNNIVDISKVGMKQFWNLKSHMQDASTLATAHYPETLDRIFVIGAPSFFPTVWSWIKRWFDPITVSKIFILSPSNTLSTLSQYIDPAHIPRKYGGKLDFAFGDLPVLEPAIADQLTFQNPATQKGAPTFPKGPIKWQEGPNGEMLAVAVGSEGGRQRSTVVASLNKPARAALHPESAAGGRPGLQRLQTDVGTDTHPKDVVDDAEADQTPDFSDNSDDSLGQLEVENPPPLITTTAPGEHNNVIQKMVGGKEIRA